MIQLTIIRIEGYGQWTLTLGSDREAQLQMLQARIYHDVQRLFSERDSIVFFNRFDEYFAITNGLDADDHLHIQHELTKLYNNMLMSMTIGAGKTAFEANLNAYRTRKEGRRMLDSNARIFGSVHSQADVAQIMHNIMVISNGMTKERTDEVLKRVMAGNDIKLNCGIGIGKTGRRAAEAATKALDTIRDLREEGKIQTIYEIQCP
jgi:GTP cyclohydrolase IIa